MPATLAVRLRARSENTLRMMATQCWMATQCRPGDTLSPPRGFGYLPGRCGVGQSPGYGAMLRSARLGRLSRALPKFRAITREWPLRQCRLMITCPYPICDASWKSGLGLLSSLRSGTHNVWPLREEGEGCR